MFVEVLCLLRATYGSGQRPTEPRTCVSAKWHARKLRSSTIRNYYHLSPHICAHVLCAPPRTRDVFLNGWLWPASARGGRAIRRLPAAVPRGSSACSPSPATARSLAPLSLDRRQASPPQTPTGTRFSIMTTKACDTLLCAQPPRHALVSVERLCNRLIERRDRCGAITANQIAKPLVNLFAA